MMKKTLSSLLLILSVLLPTNLWAQEPYAVLSEDSVGSMTLTFYYDEKMAERNGMDVTSIGGLVGLIDDLWIVGGRGWNDYCKVITTAVFDPSFADCTSITSTSGWFCSMPELTSISGLNYLNTTNVTDMSHMFRECSKLESLDVSSFNTGKVENMWYMFLGCSSLTSLDVSKFNTENVTNIGGMFMNCSGLTSLDVSGFKTNKVTEMGQMFADCTSLTSLDLSGFNTENVTRMDDMFFNCENLRSLDLSNFNTANVTTMFRMFYGCSALENLDVSNFNTEKVSSVLAMFMHCSNLTSLDLSSFSLSEITTMERMFCNVSKVEVLDLSGFKTGKVENMWEVFSGCSNLKTIYVGNDWSTASVTNGTSMFANCMSLVGGMGTHYDPNHTDYTYARIDGGENNPGYFTQNGSEAYEPQMGVVVNLINNGDLEGEESSNFFYRNMQKSLDVTSVGITDGAGVNDSRGLKVEATAMQDNVYDNEFLFQLNQPVSEGTKIKLSFDYRAEKAAKIYMAAHGDYFGDFIWDWPNPYIYADTEWQSYTFEGVVTSIISTDQKPLGRVDFSLNEYPDANIYYFDNVKFEVYMEDQCPKPTFTKTDSKVKIQSPFDAKIYYTLDGSTPTENSTLYTDALTLSENATIKAIAVVDGYEVSDVATYQFETKDVIVVSLVNNGDMEGEDNGNFFVRTNYSSGNEEPVQAAIGNGVGMNGSRGIKVEATSKLAVSWDNQFWVRLNQPISEGTLYRVSFDYRAEKEAMIGAEAHEEPTAYINWGFFGNDLSFTDSWSHFEFEGTMSSLNSKDELPFQSLTFSFNNNFEDANNYYFDNFNFEVMMENQCPKPTFKQKGNEISILSPFNAKIYYTLDGSTPTTSSQVYAGSLKLTENAEINAIAVVEGYEASPVATCKFVHPQFDSNGVLAVTGRTRLSDAMEAIGGREEVAKTITAILWEGNYAVYNTDLQGLDNPNMLIYVNDESLAPQNRDNVIIGDFAKNIVLTDVSEGNGNFYCPRTFKAEMISYTHEYRQQTEIGVARGWETIALPFTVQTIMHEKNGLIAPFGNTASSKHFWLREMTPQGLGQATVISANMPYLISMPNNSDAYTAEFNLNGRVTFSSQDVDVVVTDLFPTYMRSEGGGMLMFSPCFQTLEPRQDAYALNVGEQHGQYLEGSVFESNYRAIRPFEAFTIHEGNSPAPQFISVSDMNGGITDIGASLVNSEEENSEKWYDLNGRRLQQKPTQKGVYILNGKKAVIR